MQTTTHPFRRLAATAAFVISTAGAATQAAPIIDAGWDFLFTEPGTSFAGVPFTGVPIASFDFGPPYGPLPVGGADTIVHRLAPASVPTSPGTAPPVPIELAALSMVSAAPTDLGAGVGYYYMGLQKDRGGPASIGQMTITFDTDNTGTFDSFFDVFFDIRFGSANGPIVYSSDLVLSSSGSYWQRNPPPGGVVIDGLDHLLNGVDTSHDFWPVNANGGGGGAIIETHPTGAQHVVGSPTPGTAGVLGLGGLLVCRRRRS